MRHSITLRLVLMFALAALMTFGVIGAALYAVLRSELTRYEEYELNTTMRDMQYMIRRAGNPDRWSRVQLKMDTLSPQDGSVRFWILSKDPNYQYGSDPAAIEHIGGAPDGVGEIALPERKYPLHTLTQTLGAFEERPAIRLAIGIDSAPYYQALRNFLVALVVLSLTAVALVMTLGYSIARLGLRPLKRLSNEARTLNLRTLSQRLRISSASPAELSDLTAAFNGALGRLEDAYRQLEAFNADVAHELRTPLTNLIGETQVALSRNRSAPEFQDVLQSNLEELERLRSIINDMLFLARADQGEAATGLVLRPVGEEIAKTIEFFEFILDEMQLSVRVEGETLAQAPIDASLLRRAMTNLLQNAIQHSEAGAKIVISIEREPGAVLIAVANPGAPIADVHLARLFDRFYRVEVSRSDQGAHHGHGLGLAIVKAVAHMHGGSVFASSEHGITSIGLRLLAAVHAPEKPAAAAAVEALVEGRIALAPQFLEERKTS